MKYRFLVFFILLAASSLKAYPQAWSTFLDPSRAIDWSSAGFTVPNYTTNCSVQPTLTANDSGAAAANTNAIQNALASCDSTHNVVNIPSGTYYVNGITMPSQGFQVMRGAGANSTTLILETEASCFGQNGGICAISASPTFNGNANVMPSSGSNQCAWTGGLAQGSTTITLSSCGGAPPLNKMIILDQANDTSDTGGIYICDSATSGCTYESSGAHFGRVISGLTHTQAQVTYVTGVTNNGGGSYTVTISPGVYFSNIRSAQSPGAWWSDLTQNNGIENLTLDGSAISDRNIVFYDCYQCWVKGVRSLNAGRSHVFLYQSMENVVRDNYIYQSQAHASESYTVEIAAASANLIENNIFQQVTNPIMSLTGTGNVTDFNLCVDDVSVSTFLQGMYWSHNAGNEMNLFEGNDCPQISADDAWGSSAQTTLYRNLLTGWQGSGLTDSTTPIITRAGVRAPNFIGNILGQPGYQSAYQTIATSTSAFSGSESKSIYSLGLAAENVCSIESRTTCDPLSVSTAMRWGNWDVVNGATQWSGSEASPGSATYLNANFSSSYFGSLAHTLPNSLYYSSQPSWWPSGKPWPPVGPDVSSGNLGICSGGTYAGYQATAGSQCSGGSFSSAWAAHAISIPAQDCYLNVMHGPADGTGNVLNFDANQCYSSSGTSGSGTGPSAPSALVGTVN